MTISESSLPALGPLAAPALPAWLRGGEPRVLPPDLADSLAVHAQSPAAREQLAALRRGEAWVVVTGQQPCFPWPLGLTLQKAATAVALARRLSASGAARVAPLFWCAADDSDFEEARGQVLRRPGSGDLRLALPQTLARKGTFVGDLQPDAALADLAGLRGLGARVDRVAGEDLGQRECRLLAAIFADQGLLVLDARVDSLRRAAAPLYQRYAERRAAFARDLDAAGDRLEAETGARPLRRGLGERALFFLRSRRRSLPPSADYGDKLAERLKRDPASLSPNAALRPLVQDALLSVAAAVLGPSEWAYHHQLQDLFALMDIPLPPALPRLRAAAPGEGDAHWDRRSSPLGEAGAPLALPEPLLALANRHLDLWEAGRYCLLNLEGE